MATAQDVISYTETMLAQTSAMIVAGLPSGGGENDNYTITSDEQLLLWITEAQNRLARVCLPIYDTANFTPDAAGQATIGPYTQVTSADNRILHRPANVLIGTKGLNSANMGFLNSAGNWYQPTPDGDPTGWADNNTAIALSAYTTQPTFTINGYFLPAPITDADQELDTFIDDYSQMAMAFYVAWRVGSKNLDNSVLASRAIPCANEFVASVKEIYSRLILTDGTLAAYFPPVQLDAMVQIMKGVTPRT